jgi:hypothetical protein
MAVYKALRRLQSRPPAADLAQLRDLLTAQRGSCAICRQPLELPESRIDRGPSDAALHPSCLRLVELVRLLGPEAVERARLRADPSPSPAETPGRGVGRLS